MLILDEPAWRERRCSVISPSPFSVSSCHQPYVQHGPLSRAGKTCRAQGSPATHARPGPRRQAIHIHEPGLYDWLYNLVRCDKTDVPNAQSDSMGAFDAGHENIVYEGRRIYITLRLPEMFMHITRDHMSRKS